MFYNCAKLSPMLPACEHLLNAFCQCQSQYCDLQFILANVTQSNPRGISASLSSLYRLLLELISFVGNSCIAGCSEESTVSTRHLKQINVLQTSHCTAKDTENKKRETYEK